MRTLKIFNDTGVLQKSLQTTCETYRQYDPARYLYRVILKYGENKASDEIEE